MNCPICDLRCVTDINRDAAICPDHGVFPGLFLYQLGNTKGREAAIELSAYHVQREIADMARQARSEIDWMLPGKHNTYAGIERSKLAPFWRNTLP